MNPFKELNRGENDLLLKYPVYITLLAATKNEQSPKALMVEATKFAHTKTFTCHPLLTAFYHMADQEFAANLKQLDATLPHEPVQRETAIHNRLEALDAIITRLDKRYQVVMQKSMESFKQHVSKAHNNVLAEFIFPIPMKGLNV